jgi:hypothetical protein
MQWHDLLGAVLIDFFDGSPYVVDTEVDLSLRKQYLDIVVVRKKEGEFNRTLPDGFAPLANHNLISFKSHQDTFDFETLLELISYCVNYAKQTSSLDQLLFEGQFRLIGISSRFPDSLSKQITLEKKQSGVYDINIGPLQIRLLVIRDLANEPVNAMLKHFSIVPEQIDFACRHYRPVSEHTTGIVENLISMYRKEDKSMATTLEELNRKILKEALERASVEDRLKGLTAEDRLKGLPAEERLKGLPAEERLKGLPAEERLKGLPAEELLKGLSPEEIEAYLRTVKKVRPQENR